MEANLTQALMLMTVGMFTVFVALGLVIAVGNVLIRFVNKYVPEDEKPEPKAVASATSVAISPDIMAAVDLAVAKITNNKGKVEKIEKI